MDIDPVEPTATHDLDEPALIAEIRDLAHAIVSNAEKLPAEARHLVAEVVAAAKKHVG